MRPRLLIAAALAALTLPAATAGAASSADVMVSLEGKFNLYGKDKAAYLIDVRARMSEAGQRVGTGTVEVTIRRCVSVCSKPVTYVGALTSSQVQVAPDLGSGSIATSLFGRALSLQWSGPESNPLPAYSTDPSATQVGVYRVTGSKGLVAGSHCTTKEALLRRSVVYDGTPTAIPMPKAAPRALKGLFGGVCQPSL